MKNTQFAKLLVLINGAIPGALLASDALNHRLGANPSNSAIHSTGQLSLLFLGLTLLITPLRKLTGWVSLNAMRRGLGLYAFFYILAHFSIFFAVVHSFDIAGTLKEIINSNYLIVGSVGILAMLPLALTSTNGMVKRLGAARWNALHKLAYVAAVAGPVHYYMSKKKSVTQPLIYIAIVAALLLYRYIVYLINAGRSRASAATAAAPIAPVRKRFWSGQLRVARIFDETPQARTFRLVMPDGSDLPFQHMPGQYMNLALTIGGKRINRSYTIASSPTRANYCELTVKREDNGIASPHLHRRIGEGELLQVSAPAGKFTFTGNESDSIVLIAGGVGITPLMAVIRYLTDRCWPGQIFLIYAARTRAEVIFYDELNYLQQRYVNLHLTITLSREQSESWGGARGRITPDLLRQEVPDLQHRLIHLCGPEQMMEPIRQMLRDLGASDDRIKTEAFQYAVERTAEAEPIAGETAVETATVRAPLNGNEHIVTFATSNKTATASATRTILEASEEAGVNIDFECRSGICSTCKTRLLTGQVYMETRDALTRAEESGGFILACQAVPVSDVTVQA